MEEFPQLQHTMSLKDEIRELTRLVFLLEQQYEALLGEHQAHGPYVDFTRQVNIARLAREIGYIERCIQRKEETIEDGKIADKLGDRRINRFSSY